MATDTKTGEATGFDLTGTAKAWKEAYLGGLEAGLRWQGENEHAAKTVVKQGLLRSQQWLAFSKDYLDKSLEQVQGHQNENPFIALSRQLIQASYAVAEPAVNTGADACETAFNYYETAVAGPVRKYAVEINKKVMDTVIPN